jgi:AcrR family transcriptional regulator
VTKYCDEKVNKILDIIISTGNDRLAYESADISKETFYRWLRDRDEFLEKVLKARYIYKESQYHTQVVKALEVLDDYLLGKATETHNSEEEKTNSDDDVSHKKLTKKVRRSTPAWVIDRVLGKRMHEMEALRVLANAGWIPKEVLKEAIGGIAALKESVRKAFEDLPKSN